MANTSEWRARKHTKKQAFSNSVSLQLQNEFFLKACYKATHIQAFKIYSYKTVDKAIVKLLSKNKKKHFSAPKYYISTSRVVIAL
jgi:hypothetical protein